MSLRTTLASAFAASAVALVAAPASASITSQDGFMQYDQASSASASYSKAGYDFSIGYSEAFGARGYDWGQIFGSGTSVAYGAWASFEVPVKLFGTSVNMFKLETTATASTTAGDASYGVYVLGAKVKSGTTGYGSSMTLASHCVTFFSASGNFTLAGIPVTVSGAADGCVKLTGAMSLDTSSKKLSVTVTPSASIDATLKGGVGVTGYSAGVKGEITIVEASLPLTGTVQITQGSAITVGYKGNVTLTGLSGSVSAYLDLFGEEVADKEIFSWSGMTYAGTSLFNGSTTIAY